MNHRKLTVLAGAALLSATLPIAATSAARPTVIADPVAHGQVHAKDTKFAKPARPTKNPNMTYHGGKIMKSANATAIFWGTTWPAPSAAPNGTMTGLDSWYQGEGGSKYAATSDEYTDSTGSVGPALSYTGHLVDTSAASGGGNTSVILNEVSRALSANHIAPDPSGNGYYPVYTDVKRGSAQYCAWHSSGSISGVPVQFAFFFNLTGDAGCDPQDTTTGHSQNLAALANVTAHELSEARTDPASPGAWYDGSGAENGDKCAWTFNVSSVSFPNGTIWKLQGEWSNNAYSLGTGYPNSSGQKGCLDGH